MITVQFAVAPVGDHTFMVASIDVEDVEAMYHTHEKARSAEAAIERHVFRCMPDLYVAELSQADPNDDDTLDARANVHPDALVWYAKLAEV